MVTDVLTGARRARMIGSLAAVNAVGPWPRRSSGRPAGHRHLAVDLLGARRRSASCSSLVVLATFRETLPPERRAHGVGLRGQRRPDGALLKIPRFSLYLATSCVATVGFFAYIATSSFVFQTGTATPSRATPWCSPPTPPA